MPIITGDTPLPPSTGKIFATMAPADTDRCMEGRRTSEAQGAPRHPVKVCMSEKACYGCGLLNTGGIQVNR